jgi:hypothetical protein
MIVEARFAFRVLVLRLVAICRKRHPRSRRFGSRQAVGTKGVNAGRPPLLPQTLSASLVQYDVTVVSNALLGDLSDISKRNALVLEALDLERSERSPRGLPTKVISESLLASQSLNCSGDQITLPDKVSNGQ